MGCDDEPGGGASGVAGAVTHTVGRGFLLPSCATRGTTSLAMTTDSRPRPSHLTDLGWWWCLAIREVAAAV